MKRNLILIIAIMGLASCKQETTNDRALMMAIYRNGYADGQKEELLEEADLLRYSHHIKVPWQEGWTNMCNDLHWIP